MKITLTLLSLLFCLSAFASFNEVECEGKVQEKVVSIEVEQAFPRGSYFKQARLAVDQDNYFYTVTTRATSFGRIDYVGGGLRLEIDLWPDQNPRWGQTYKARLSSSDLGNQSSEKLSCTFVGI